MITDKDYYEIINNLKPHTITSIRENQNRLLPVFNTGKMFVIDKYRLNDVTKPYIISADNPDSDYSIIYAENVPFKNTDNHHSHQSFNARLDKMVYDQEVEPFLLFINHRFIKWSDIEIIHNYDDTYLKIYDHKFNFFNIKKIDMLIFPFNIECESIETDYQFDTNLEKITKYINNASFINKQDQLTISIPDIKDSYEGYDIGKWYYSQVKLFIMGQLSDDKINKLKNIEVNKFIYNSKGVAIKSYCTTLNLLDKDSYKLGTLESTYSSNIVLFKFNDDGELDDNGKTIVYMNNDNMSIFKDTFTSNTKYNELSNLNAQLFPENIIIFKNNLICNTGYNIDIGLHNNMTFSGFDKSIDYNLDGSTYTSTSNNKISCYVFYDNRIESPHNLLDKFPNKAYINNKVAEYYKKQNTLPYIKSLYDNMDFEMRNDRVFKDNYDIAYNKFMNDDPTIFESLQERYIYSRCLTGEEVNSSLNIPTALESRYGMKIPRMSYEDHETFVMIFHNNLLIENYCELEVHSNYFYLPVSKAFNNNDTIELLYFTNCNNNEAICKYNKNNIVNSYDDIIPNDEVNLFINEKLDSILTYPMITYDMNKVSFPISDSVNKMNTINNDAIHNHNIVITSTNRFVYKRIYVEGKSYKLKLDERFRYCNKQSQYILFINGRKINNIHYFITTYKVTRPFNDLYLYTTRFVKPTDRVEVFYVPQEMMDNELTMNNFTTLQYPLGCTDYTLDTDAYLIYKDRTKLSVPLSSDNYLFFMNGKKIAKSELIDIKSNIIRFNKDIRSFKNLFITCIVKNPMENMGNYLQSNKNSLWDSTIDTILNDKSLGKNELDILFNSYIKLSNTEDNYINKNTGNIAVLNEIVRDFWVTSGYDYQAHPFVYDYVVDEFKTYDEHGHLIIPSMDAQPNINISKYDLHYLYFQFDDDMKEYYEIGSSIYKPTFKWEYNQNYEDDGDIIAYQRFNGKELDIDDREYTVNDLITTDTKFTLESSDGYSDCSIERWIRFCNGIYYATIDEDLMDGRESDIYSNNPSAMLDNEMVNILYQPKPQLSLYDFEIGNNMYMVFAMPKRLAFDENGKSLISFYGPNITKEEFIAALDDNKTTPVLTNGEVDNQNNPIKLDSYKFEIFEGNFGGEFEYTNRSGYKETYVIFKSNGYFTRIFGTYKFNFFIK